MVKGDNKGVGYGGKTETISTNVAISRVANLMYRIGERVVHPQHGVGEIVKLEDRQFEGGKTHSYYEISFPGGSTLWVPVDGPNPGLRYLATRREITACRKILASRPLALTEDGRVRQSELVARLRQGTIAVQSEVVRDLSAYVARKPFYVNIMDFLDAIQDVLCQEWAVVEAITISEAASEIVALLEKSRSSAASK